MTSDEKSDPEAVHSKDNKHEEKAKDKEGNMSNTTATPTPPATNNNVVFMAAQSPSQVNSTNNSNFINSYNDNRAAAAAAANQLTTHEYGTLVSLLVILTISIVVLYTALKFVYLLLLFRRNPNLLGPVVLVLKSVADILFLLALGCLFVLIGLYIIVRYHDDNDELNREIAEDMAASGRQSPAPGPEDTVLRGRGHHDNNDEQDRIRGGYGR